MSALLKQVDTGVGYSATYHRLAEAHWITATNEVVLKVALYKDAQSFLDGYAPIRTDTYTIDGGFTSELYAGVDSACMGVLAALPEFAGAEVVE